jgi:hypothetical protein
MIFTDRINDITYQQILPSIVDQVNNSNVFTSRVLTPRNSGAALTSWKGTSYQQPITVGNSATGGAFDGMDTFSTAATNNTRLLTWYVKAYEQSVVVPGLEKAVNGNSEKQVLSLLATRMDEAKNSMANSVGDLLYGLGSGKNFDGLALIVDNGTATAAYGGLTRATNTFLNADVTTAATLTLDTIGTEFDAASAASSSSEAPTLGLTTKAVWSLFEGLMTPTISSMYNPTTMNGYNRVDGGTPNGTTMPASELKASAGFVAITYRGRPVVADDKCPAGTFFWLNENYMEFPKLTIPDLTQISSVPEVTEGYYKKAPSTAFQFREMMSPVNQLGQVGFFVLAGNLIHKQPRRNSKLIGITGN